MFEIRGEYASAVCYANVVDNEAVAQVLRMCNSEFAENSLIRIMPDVHAGVGCTIGTTMTITGKVVPNIVGVDIGCGMLTVNLGKLEMNETAVVRRLNNACYALPSGHNAWDRAIESFPLTELRCYRYLKDVERIRRSLGSLGGGNHFIELDKDKHGVYYLIIHSGSRNLGKQVAEHYQRVAIELHGKRRLKEQRDALIADCKRAGRSEDIQKKLTALNAEFHKSARVPNDLAYLYGTDMEDYLHDMAICQQYAKRNRELIAEFLLAYCRYFISPVEQFHTIHNYIDLEHMILRKGAVSAQAGERILIPINMKDGCILATGRGNPEWNCSAPHGAGRILSRRQAKETLSLEEYEREMQGVYSTTVGLETIDESPMAYKRLSDILDVVQESVDVVEMLKPVFNFKGVTYPRDTWSGSWDMATTRPEEQDADTEDALVSVEDAKAYLCLGAGSDDILIARLLSSAEKLCIDASQITAEQWSDLNMKKKDGQDSESDRIAMRSAILYALSYLYEHLDESDHSSLTLTLRSLFFVR